MMKSQIKEKMNSLNGYYRIKTLKNGKVIRETPLYKNLVLDGTDTGFNLILKRLYGDTTYSTIITHLEIGTGTTPPTLADTGLETPIARTVWATKEISADSITYQFFFADTYLADGTYTELGLFIDGTGTLESGKIFTRSLLSSAYVKDTGEDTIIEYILSK